MNIAVPRARVAIFDFGRLFLRFFLKLVVTTILNRINQDPAKLP